jgi:membrane protein implicated in regulation of membrane protease activity
MTDKQEVDVSEESSPSLKRWFIIGFAGLGALILIALVIAVIVALTGAEGGLATGFQVVRDALIIILALQGVFISVAMIVLILQFSALVNLLRNEVKPLIDEVRDTASAAKGTAQFVGKNVAEPVIKVASTAAGVTAFLGELTGIRRNVSGRNRVKGN